MDTLYSGKNTDKLETYWGGKGGTAPYSIKCGLPNVIPSPYLPQMSVSPPNAYSLLKTLLPSYPQVGFNVPPPSQGTYLLGGALIIAH